MLRKLVVTLIAILFSFHAIAQRQYADTLYEASIVEPIYKNGEGPTIWIDEGHYNFHTKDGRYKPFANILEQDGYIVNSSIGVFTKDKLDSIEILVIANALHESNTQGWKLPNPSAFTKEEIELVNNWVKNGGSLFLLADHMPFPGAASELAASFGYTFINGFASDSSKQGSDLFTRAEETLINSALTNNKYQIDSIRSFTGQVFEIPEEATTILKCHDKWVSYQPEEP